MLLLKQGGCLNFSWTWIALKQRLRPGHRWAKWAASFACKDVIGQEPALSFIQAHNWTNSDCPPSSRGWSLKSLAAVANILKKGVKRSYCAHQLPVDTDYVLVNKCAPNSLYGIHSGQWARQGKFVFIAHFSNKAIQCALHKTSTQHAKGSHYERPFKYN